MNISTQLGRLRLLAILEGVSYLLFAITMPLKRIYEIPEPNYYVGMIHGILFMLYCLWVVIVANQLNWNFKRVLLCLVASLFPFTTFVVDHKILKPASY